MKSVFILVGEGANSVEFPCLWFSTEEKAVAYIEPVLGKGKRNKKGCLCWNADIEEKWGTDEYEENKETDPATKFFISYYNGCGGIYSFKLMEVKEGTPFAVFDLGWPKTYRTFLTIGKNND